MSWSVFSPRSVFFGTLLRAGVLYAVHDVAGGDEVASLHDLLGVSWSVFSPHSEIASPQPGPMPHPPPSKLPCVHYSQDQPCADATPTSDGATCLSLTVTVLPVPVSAAYGSGSRRRVQAQGDSTLDVTVGLPDTVTPALVADGASVTVLGLVTTATSDGSTTTTLVNRCSSSA